MKYLLPLLFLLSFTTHAQRRRGDDTAHYRSEPIPAHLMPIERAIGGGVSSVYFYGGKKLSSPYSLEVPFYELNDRTVTHHFQTFRTMTTLSRIVGLIPLGYVLLNRNTTNGAYWTVYGGSVVASLTLGIIGNSQVNKAVGRYNEMMRQPRVGVSASPIPLTRQYALGAGISWEF